MTHDVILVGRGLAGSVLAEQLLARGLRVRVFDAPRPGNASRVAAGVVNPIVLRRVVPTWRAAMMREEAETLYLAEQRYAVRFWYPMDLVKVFPTANDLKQWTRAEADPEAVPFLSRERRADVDASPIDTPFGYGIVKRCAWLDVNAWLDAQHTRLSREGVLHEAWIGAGDVIFTGDGIRVRDAEAPVVIACEGPFAQEVPGLVPVRGELLTVRIPGLVVNCMVHRGVFVLPVGNDLYRVGATFAWNDPFIGPTPEGRQDLLDRLKKLTGSPVEVIEHLSGVRPTARDRRPIIGRSSRSSRMFVLNGLGARGVMLAPWCAQRLIAYIFDGAPLDPEVDAARFA